MRKLPKSPSPTVEEVLATEAGTERRGIIMHIEGGPDEPTLSVFRGHDTQVVKWLAAKRQQLEQEYSMLKREVRESVQAVEHILDKCHTCEDLDTKTENMIVLFPVWNFTLAAIRLHQCEAELRALGIAPERCGVTPEVWAQFLSVVTAPDSDDEGEEEAA
jgi:hypothetical protein